MINIKAQYRTI